MTLYCIFSIMGHHGVLWVVLLASLIWAYGSGCIIPEPRNITIQALSLVSSHVEVRCSHWKFARGISDKIRNLIFFHGLPWDLEVYIQYVQYCMYVYVHTVVLLLNIRRTKCINFLYSSLNYVKLYIYNLFIIILGTYKIGKYIYIDYLNYLSNL